MCTFSGSVHFCTLHVQCTKMFGKIGPSTTSTNSSVAMYTACAVYKNVHCTCSVHFVYIYDLFRLTSGTQMSNDLCPAKWCERDMLAQATHARPSLATLTNPTSRQCHQRRSKSRKRRSGVPSTELHFERSSTRASSTLKTYSFPTSMVPGLFISAIRNFWCNFRDFVAVYLLELEFDRARRQEEGIGKSFTFDFFVNIRF